MNTQLLDQVHALGIDEQLELLEAIWNSLANRGSTPPLTASQEAELDRRLADYLENPDDVFSWNEVKAAALAKISQ